MKVHLTLGAMGYRSRVEIDGVDVTRGVAACVVRATVTSRTEVVLTLLPDEVLIDGEAGEVLRALPEQKDPAGVEVSLSLAKTQVA